MLFEIFDKKIELPIKNIMSSCSSRDELVLLQSFK